MSLSWRAEEITSANIELFSENISPLLKEPFIITTKLFSFTEEDSFDELVSLITQYNKADPNNTQTIERILGIFSIVRPKKHELLSKIEKATLIYHTSMEASFETILGDEIPHIFKLNRIQSPLIDLIKNDNLKELEETITKNPNFDINQTFKIDSYDINLLDIAAYYGSEQCIFYLMVQEVPLTEYFCPFLLCSGNTKRIKTHAVLWRDHHTFRDEICLKLSILYHLYEQTDWLVQYYNSRLNSAKTSIESYNFYVFWLFITNKYPIPPDEAYIIGNKTNLPIFQYLSKLYDDYIKQIPMSLFLRAKQVSPNQENTGEGEMRFIVNDFTRNHVEEIDEINEIEEISEYSQIPEPHIRTIFKHLFDINNEDGKKRLMSFLNSIYFPREDTYIITNIEPLQTEISENSLSIDILCRCYATNINNELSNKPQIIFNVGINNEYLSSRTEQYFKNGTKLQTTFPDHPFRYLILSHRGILEDKHSLFSKDENLLFYQINIKDSDQFHLTESTVLKPINTENTPQINIIDIKNTVFHILNNTYKIHAFSFEGLEWFKLLGVSYWSQFDTQLRRYIIPSSQHIVSESVSEAVSFLDRFDQAQNIEISYTFKGSFETDRHVTDQIIEESVLKSQIKHQWQYFLINRHFVQENGDHFPKTVVEDFLDQHTDKEQVNQFIKELSEAGMLEQTDDYVY